MAVDCEIYEVPMDEQGGEQEEPSSPIEKPRKERKKRKPLTEEQKERCRNNLAKARAIRKLMVEKEQKAKERIQREYEQTQLKEVEQSDDEELPIEDRLLKRPKPKGRKPKTKIIVEDAARPRRGRRSRRGEGDSDGDGSEDSWESEEEPEPKRPRKTKPRAPKVKKISQKEQRLALLESKLDDIIAHTKKSMEKPRVRNTKSTTTIIQAPREPSPAINPDLKRAAVKILSMF
jgi:hypothetical protein